MGHDYSLADIGAFLTSLVVASVNGFKKETVSIQMTKQKAVVLRGKTKFLASALILFTASILLFVFLWMILVMVGVIR